MSIHTDTLVSYQVKDTERKSVYPNCDPNRYNEHERVKIPALQIIRKEQLP